MNAVAMLIGDVLCDEPRRAADAFAGVPVCNVLSLSLSALVPLDCSERVKGVAVLMAKFQARAEAKARTVYARMRR